MIGRILFDFIRFVGYIIEMMGRNWGALNNAPAIQAHRMYEKPSKSFMEKIEFSKFSRITTL